jgi:hypothetical protein
MLPRVEELVNDEAGEHEVGRRFWTRMPDLTGDSGLPTGGRMGGGEMERSGDER